MNEKSTYKKVQKEDAEEEEEDTIMNLVYAITT